MSGPRFNEGQQYEHGLGPLLAAHASSSNALHSQQPVFQLDIAENISQSINTILDQLDIDLREAVTRRSDLDFQQVILPLLDQIQNVLRQKKTSDGLQRQLRAMIENLNQEYDDAVEINHAKVFKRLQPADQGWIRNIIKYSADIIDLNLQIRELSVALVDSVIEKSHTTEKDKVRKLKNKIPVISKLSRDQVCFIAERCSYFQSMLDTNDGELDNADAFIRGNSDFLRSYTELSQYLSALAEFIRYIEINKNNLKEQFARINALVNKISTARDGLNHAALTNDHYRNVENICKNFNGLTPEEEIERLRQLHRRIAGEAQSLSVMKNVLTLKEKVDRLKAAKLEREAREKRFEVKVSKEKDSNDSIDVAKPAADDAIVEVQPQAPFRSRTPTQPGFIRRHWLKILGGAAVGAASSAAVGAGLGVFMGMFAAPLTFGLSIPVLAGIGAGAGALYGAVAGGLTAIASCKVLDSCAKKQKVPKDRQSLLRKNEGQSARKVVDERTYSHAPDFMLNFGQPSCGAEQRLTGTNKPVDDRRSCNP